MNARLKVFSFGLAFGVTWAIGVALLGLLAWQFSWGNAMVDVFGSLYVGYSASLKGILIGTGYALADGFIGGVLLAFFYNLFSGQ